MTTRRIPEPALSGHARVAVVYERMAHFGAHSGWIAVLPHLQRRIWCERLEPRAAMPRLSAWTVDRVVRPADVPWYNFQAFRREWAAARILRYGPRVICHFLYGEGAFHYLGRLRARSNCVTGRIVCTFHQPPELFEAQIGRRTRLDQIDAVLVQASNQADHLAARVEDSRLFVIPHGVDTRYFKPPPLPTVPITGVRRFVCVGSWLRDFATLRSVALRLAQQEPAVRLLVVGNARDLTRLRGIPNVEVLSGISDRELLAAYHGAAGAILPLRDATGNNALLEAMACGLPLVATRVGGLGDYVDQRGAFLVAPGDSPAMCAAVLRLAREPGLAVAMGQHNRARSLGFDWERTANALLEVYARLL